MIKRRMSKTENIRVLYCVPHKSVRIKQALDSASSSGVTGPNVLRSTWFELVLYRAFFVSTVHLTLFES